MQWNPHAEAVIEVGGALRLPTDVAQRRMPAQSQAIDGAAIVANMRLRPGPAGDRVVGFAPLWRMEVWGVTPLKVGDRVEPAAHRAPVRQRSGLRAALIAGANELDRTFSSHQCRCAPVKIAVCPFHNGAGGPP